MTAIREIACGLWDDTSRGAVPIPARWAGLMIRLALLLALAAVSSPVPCAAVDQWQQTAGPGAVGINVLYRNGAEVLAGTNGEGVYRSTDNGATWLAANGGLAGVSVQALAANSSFLFAGVVADDFGHGGVYRSSDDGATWTPANTGIENKLILCLFTDGPRLYAGDVGDGVYKSTDNGATWTLSNNGIGNQSVRAMAKSSNFLFAAGDNFTYRSTDNGANWNDIPPLDFFAVFSMVADGSRLYAGGWDRVALSTDSGNSWSFSDLNFPSLARIPALDFDGNRVYAGTDAAPGLGVYASTDNGATWAPSNAGIEIVSVNTLAAIPGHVLAGTPQKGVLASRDNGATWAASNAGLPPGGNIRKLVFDGTGMIAATGGNGILRSSDFGTSWTHIDDADGGLLKNEIVFSVAPAPGALFAGTASSGIYRSTNGGAHWTQADNGIPANDRSILDLAAAGSTIVAGTGQNGIFYSSDSGGSWHAANAPAGTAEGLAASTSGLIYAILNTGIGNTTGIYRSADAGRTWTLIFQAGSQSPTSIAADGAFVYVGDLLSGMMRSTDNGNSWTDISPAPGVGIFSILPRGTDLYAGAQQNSGEVYKSTDRGDHWTVFNQGLEVSTSVEALGADNFLIWAGTDQRAVWTRSILDPAAVPPPDGMSAASLDLRAATPFRLSTEITFRLSSASDVRLDVFDASGRALARLIDRRLDPGTYSQRFDAGAYPAGVYFARISADGRKAVRRLVSIR